MNMPKVARGPGNDTLIGGGGNDSLNGGGGNDVFIGSQGNDTLNGASGNDTVNYNSTNTAITLKPLGVVTKAIGGTDSLIQVEHIIADADFASSNTIDTSTATGAATINVNLSTNSLSVNTGSPVGILNFSVENFNNVVGTNNNDVIVGNNFSNNLNGGGGNDTINGGGGNDSVIGGTGSNLFVGSSGNDTLNGTLGTDTVNYSSDLNLAVTLKPLGVVTKSDGSVDSLIRVEHIVADVDKKNLASDGNTIDASTATGTGKINVNLSSNSLIVNTGISSIGTLNFSVENFNNVIGTNNNDTITGDSDGNRLNGLGGNDLIDGGSGNDILFGGLGNNTLNGGDGVDLVNFIDDTGGANNKGVNVNLTSGIAIGDGVDTLSVFTIENIAGSLFNDTIVGNDLNNQLFGDFGKDTMNGAGGNDSLIGSFDNDVLTGASGNDTLNGAGRADSGKGTIDSLTGGIGADRFELSGLSSVFYNDGNNNTSGANDYALILDFSVAQGDTIRLAGTASDYVLGASSGGRTNIFLKTDGTDELIGVVQSPVGLNLNASYFVYVPS